VKKKNIQIAQLFGDRATVNMLSQRVDSAESKLLDVSGRWEGLTQRVTTLEGTVSRSLQQNRKYAQSLTDKLHQQITAELDARTSVLDVRLRQVESEQTAQRTQIAQVEGELRHEITSAREETDRDLSGVHQDVETNSRSLNSLSQRMDRKRIDFEVAKGRTIELVSGVELEISGANNQYQRFRGSLWLLQDRRTLWLRDESVNQSVRFYHKEGGEPYELVVTDVTQKHSVVGYLLVPVQKEPAVGTLPDTDSRTQASTSGSD
jgi:chaperonin cofactor prefoldin